MWINCDIESDSANRAAGISCQAKSDELADRFGEQVNRTVALFVTCCIGLQRRRKC